MRGNTYFWWTKSGVLNLVARCVFSVPCYAFRDKSVGDMIIKRFEDIEIWQEARELCKIVYEITSLGLFSTDYKFRDQMRASVGSTVDNIAEGFDRGGNKEFHQFLSVSKRSCGEVRSQSYRAFDNKYITEVHFIDLLERTDRLSRKTSNLMHHLKSSPRKGIKYS